MDKQTILAFVIKHRERLTLVGLALGLVVFVGIGVYLQRHNQGPPAQEASPALKKVEFTPQQGTAADRSQEAGKSHAYYLKPSPGELLETITAMQGLNDDAASRKLLALRVIWPVYFFSAEGTAKQKQLLLDVSEDGFGVVVRGEVAVADYPLAVELEQGEKLWVGGEITAVDPNGTGTVYLQIEYLGRSMPDGQKTAAAGTQQN